MDIKCQEPIISITLEQIELSRRKLSRGKARGVDELPDIYFKDTMIWNQIKTKMLRFFNQLYAGEHSPST